MLVEVQCSQVKLHGKDTDLVSGAFEGVGSCASGKISEEELQEIENSCCPTCGSCAGLFTANSMNCLAEALGMALPGMVQYQPPMVREYNLQKDPDMQLLIW